MILIKRLDTPTSDNESCNKRALYQFTDAKEDEKGEYKTITIGYSCEHCVEEVNKMLKETYHGN